MLIGSGLMSSAYANILKNLGVNFTVHGRGKVSAAQFERLNGIKPVLEKISDYYKDKNLPKSAIVAVSNDQLSKVTLELISMGIKNILVEKPGGINQCQLQNLLYEANKKGIKVFIGLNRRFYASIEKAKEIINEDGGVLSCNFQFTEWFEQFRHEFSEEVCKTWLVSNAIHVLDTFIYLCGVPLEYSSYRGLGIDLHESGSIFVGSGVTSNNVFFSYHSNWQGPGRWSLEIITKKNKIILCPMEELSVVKKFSFEVVKVDIENIIDKEFKPGLYKQTKSFLEEDFTRHCSLEEQIRNFKFYYEVAGYE